VGTAQLWIFSFTRLPGFFQGWKKGEQFCHSSGSQSADGMSAAAYSSLQIASGLKSGVLYCRYGEPPSQGLNVDWR
jgi:hypothetical protein